MDDVLNEDRGRDVDVRVGDSRHAVRGGASQGQLRRVQRYHRQVTIEERHASLSVQDRATVLYIRAAVLRTFARNVARRAARRYGSQGVVGRRK